MPDRNNVLFYESDLYAVLQAQLEDIQHRVDKIPDAQFRSNSDEQVVNHIVSEMTIEPLVIHEDRKQMKPEERQMDVSEWPGRNFMGDRGPIMVASLRLTVTLPYSGESALWKCKPNTWGGTMPRGRPSSNGNGAGDLVMLVELPTDSDPNEFKRAVEERLKAVRDYVGYQKPQIEQHNSQLPGRIQTAVARRRTRMGKAADILKAIDIPMAPKPGAPDVSQLPIKRKLVIPLAPASAGERSYQIADAIYEHILGVIRHVGATFESTRETLAPHGEEDLRNFILANLNGHYEGEAKAEAFRRAGKTDITIERENRAAFVAECKVWKGAQQLTAAIDQLLNYLTWRDGKTALILFNKDIAGFSELQAKLPDSVKTHALFASVVPGTSPGEWRFRFKAKDDDARLVVVHVFMFDLYVSKDRRGS